ncbi:serine protease [Aurantiacibacter xanthus]|uniref:Serine protease n=1 Tax=Aurantiacibacter xanthus TaxID=1784712 RepID=A0A3A1PD65_9SPHN|nr:serine protease [Aurantiacibacter xanthus]RIV91494.1 serine protease [Aurantiacibacter xanthus]
MILHTTRILALALSLLFAAMVPSAPAQADEADIAAAARGVVRVVIIGRDGDEIFPIAHGTGFVVAGERIVTNAHVINPAIEDKRLAIGIVPPEGGDAVYARPISVSPRNDLAILATTKPMNLPVLTIAGNPASGQSAVTAIGYPMNVDRAQGLDQNDLFRATPPVLSTGFLSGRRPSREMDTLLHTAPIARGNSGGPLVDNCGRVIGVNSFGAESEGTEAEFFFAVSTRELLPFLRANDIQPQLNALPCRSLAELDAEDEARRQQTLAAEQRRTAAAEAALAMRRDELRRDITYRTIDARTNQMALALLLFIIALAAGGTAYLMHLRADMRMRAISGSVAIVALVAALVAWLTRPAFADIENELEAALNAEQADGEAGADPGDKPSGAILSQATYSCVLDQQRSRVTSAPEQDVEIGWTAQGCVNGRTQYGLNAGDWTRVLVPSSEAAVSVNRFDPEAREYVVERYLLDRDAMSEARERRGKYEAPQCGAGDQAATQLGIDQSTVVSALPDRPNERLVYTCTLAKAGAD